MIDAASARRAPLGVLVLGLLLLFLGAGLIVAPTYLLLAGTEGRHLGWAAMAASGCLTLYLSAAVLSMRRWAWTAIIALLVLMLASSVVRAALADEPPVAPVAEILLELLALGYLARRPVRDAFRRAS